MKEVFLVQTTRDFMGKPLRHVRYCETKEGCELYIKECRTKGHSIDAAYHFVRAENPSIVEIEHGRQ